MEVVLSFLITAVGGVVCHLIVKRLDRKDKDDKWPDGGFATIKEKKNPPTV